LGADGIALIGQLAGLGDRELASRYGRMGARLACLARREDDRAVLAHALAQTVSAETTLAQDEANAVALSRVLWPLCERVSARLKQASLATGTITLKLKTADFHLRTRSRRVPDPTQLADTLFHTASALLAGEANGVTHFRLIGVGADHLFDSRVADPPGLFDHEINRPRCLEQAIGEIRGRLGEEFHSVWSQPPGRALPDRSAQPSPHRRRDGRAPGGPGTEPSDRFAVARAEAVGGLTRSLDGGQQLGLVSGSMSSSLARMEYSP
jgi:hypothetical protein